MDQPLKKSELVSWPNSVEEIEQDESRRKKMLKADRPAVYKREDGKIAFRPSEIGHCTRGLVASLLGETPAGFTEQQLRNMGEGHIHEPVAVREWEAENGGVVQRHVQLELHVSRNMVIEGCCDGVWFIDGDEIDSSLYYTIGENIFYLHTYEEMGLFPAVMGVEIKAPDDGQFDVMSKSGPTENYRWQISVYWYMIQICLGVKLMGMVFILRRRRDGMPHRIIIDEPFHTMQQIQDKMQNVVNLAAKGLDAAECDKNDFFCNWWHLHKLKPGETKKQAAWDPKMSDLALAYHRCGIGQVELSNRQDMIKESIEQAMMGRDKVRTWGFTLSYSQKDCFNRELCAAENPHLIELFPKVELDVDALLASEYGDEMRKRYGFKGKRSLTIYPRPSELDGGDIKVKSERQKKSEQAKKDRENYNKNAGFDPSKITENDIESWFG